MQGNDNVLANKEKIKKTKRLQFEIWREKETRRKSESVGFSCVNEELDNNMIQTTMHLCSRRKKYQKKKESRKSEYFD